MKPRFFTILTVLSLVLCILAAALWVRSYFWYARLTNVPSGVATRHYAAYSRAGIVEFTTWIVERTPASLPSKNRWSLTTWRTNGPWRDLKDEFLLGAVKFRLYADGAQLARGNLIARHLWISYSYPTLALAIAPLLWLWNFARARAAKDIGRCKRCGYDLRATPERCPECGTPTATNARPDAAFV